MAANVNPELMAPPPDPNESRQGVLLGPLTVLLLLSLGFYGLRLYSRIRPKMRVSWDDYSITLSVILAIILFGVTCQSAAYGFGRHAITVTPNHMVGIMLLTYISQLALMWSVTFTKISVAFMLLRIRRSKIWIWGMWGSIVILMGAAIAYTVIISTECIPTSDFWNRAVKPELAAHCRKPKKGFYTVISTSIIIIISDVFFSLIPLTFIFKINRPLREKIVLAILMAMGLCASVASIVRVVSGVSVFKTPDNGSTASLMDPTWDSVYLLVWGFVEVYLGIVAACVPCLKAFFERALRRVGITVNGSSRTSGAHPSQWTTMRRGAYDLKSESPRSRGAWPGHTSDCYPGTYDNSEYELLESDRVVLKQTDLDIRTEFVKS
ncbi:hypothetical protein P152DRAFT_462912 [Eremomyces bilateralis CBS 781.70]|uniref:Rhodopsin domain-containing protein n=1 Tax=Eremomyces bilateralis CBS 781.70 TaxID=1392243 RepID=A0A6G1FR10_9PEZI|nr:uncharacterized protein P152DRAFT_462912 [Eremomyces bilateralis CBS 781.70]KAF1808102.1 hypothetical protein P152DRAFT_462912 [Eremomyces bilateralis CBS 781.70]